ncbi:MAG: Uma2 family endonuclease [Cyanobacteria bacterium J06635_10]
MVQPLRQLYRSRHPYPENVFWVIEFANTSLSKDLDTKRKAYAYADIKEYWVVDLKNRLVEVFRNPVNGNYVE